MQASELLTREIAAGHWRGGERLPTEAELAATLGMAIGTIRKALAELAARGLLERRQGSGTYVRAASKHEGPGDPARSRSIYEFFRLELAAGGGLPEARLIDFADLPRPASVPAFGDGESARCYRIRRLRLLGGRPAALEEIYFDARHRPGLEAGDLSEALYLFYKEQFGFWISHVDDHVSVGTVPNWAPAAFGLAVGQPCGTVERQSWAGSNAREEYSNTWFDPAVARYTARWR
jgi:GntR family transcriptional regulator